jgi:hypothetical protein
MLDISVFIHADSHNQVAGMVIYLIGATRNKPPVPDYDVVFLIIRATKQ